MRAIRKTGVRQPWQPSPLQGNSDPLRPPLVVADPPDATLALSSTVWIGRLTRLPNTDPLRPPIVIQDVPDATLALGQAQLIGRLPRPEDVNWPARPVAVVGVPVPVPGARLAVSSAPRDANTDPLRPMAVVADPPDATLTQPSTTPIGRLPRPEDTSRPARPAVMQTGAQPLPGASALTGYAPRDQAVAQPDRLSPTTVIGATLTPFGAVATPVGRPRMADRAGAPPIVIGQAGIPVAGQTLWSARPREDDHAGRAPQIARPADQPATALAQFVGRAAEADQAGRAPVVVGVRQVQPGAQLYWSMALRDLPVAYTLGTIRGPGPDGTVLGPIAAGEARSANAAGTILAPLTSGQARGPKMSGSIKG